MNDDEHSGLPAFPHDDESVLILGMIRIRDDQSLIVEEHGFRFFERDAVLSSIALRLV